MFNKILVNDRLPLVHEIRKNNFDNVKILVEKYKININRNKNSSGNGEKNDNAIFYASTGKKLEILKYLLDHGGNINIKDYLGDTVLHYASYRNELETVKFLLTNGADINIRNNDGQTPLMDASKRCNLTIIKYLIKKGADPLIKDLNGFTAYDIVPIQEEALPIIFYFREKVYGKEYKRKTKKKSGETINFR